MHIYVYFDSRTHTEAPRDYHAVHVNISTSFNFLTSIFNRQHDALDLHPTIENIYIWDFAHDSIDVLCDSEHPEHGRLRPKHVGA
jgi:hypothetical protein